MITIFYNSALFLVTLCLFPQLLLKWVLRGDRSLFSYLGGDLPLKRDFSKKCFLFYAVSVGETKALSSFYSKVKLQYPEAEFFIASRTVTGQEEAKRSLPLADGYFILPLDFSWSMRRLYRRLHPTAVFIVEGDLWYHFLQEAKKQNIFTALISAKISERSYKRFKNFPSFSRFLFSSFSLICAQSKLFADRLIELGANPSSTFITGNLKLESSVGKLSSLQKREWRQKLGICSDDFVLVVGSTHAPEEEGILEVLLPLWQKYPQLKCFIVPRHPERFVEVSRMLSEKGLSFIAYSNLACKTGKERLVCIDTMGLLTNLYQISDVAIVAGSFASHLKGHNIIEPIQQGVPVLFGPYMSDQADLVKEVLAAKAGVQINLDSLSCVLEGFLQDSSFLEDLSLAGKKFVSTFQDTATKTADICFSSLKDFGKN